MTYIEELHRGDIYFSLYHPEIPLTPRLDSGELGSWDTPHLVVVYNMSLQRRPPGTQICLSRFRGYLKKVRTQCIILSINI